jgi:hypothetical protein
MSLQNTGLEIQTVDPWTHHMLNGEYELAWNYADEALACRAGVACWHLPRHLQYIWNGSALTNQRVLVRCYHGLGDTIQFIRYIPMLKQIAQRVIVWAQPKLLGLLNSVPGIDELLPLHDGTPGCSYDVDVEIMELPHIFRSTLGTIPRGVPYLYANGREELSTGDELAVGLVWQSGDWDARRSMQFSQLYPLAEVRGARFHILQPGAMEAGWQQQFGVYHGEHDLNAYARFLSGLDLLISIDSMPVHLAGALGVNVWTMLQAEADWRWMRERDDSPWYPTMRLFRQENPGDWEPVVDKIRTELRKLVLQRSFMNQAGVE